MSSQTYTTGPGLCTLLTVAFVVLKLTGQITWPWIWVLAPTWIPLSIVLLVLLIFLAITFSSEVTVTKRSYKKGRS